MKEYNYAAPCLMGVEKLLSNELKFMGAHDVHAENGRVFFSGGAEMAARANLRSRIAERILIVCAKFSVNTFDELFNGVRAVNWSEYLPKNASFPVTGSCISSQLKSVSDCQAIIKKAIAESLCSAYHVNGFMPEDGSVYKVRFLLFKDNISVMLDTTGEALHKRGYRANSGGAPMKETLAAAVTELARVRKNTTVIDPCCGSGTLIIEAAQRALSIAPGISRSFAAENWEIIPSSIWEKEREAARADVRTNVEFRGIGCDIDKNVIEIARENAQKAGVADYVEFHVRDIADFHEIFERAVVVCNPPYGERLLDITQAEKLYTVMGEKFAMREGWSYNIICPDDDFERFFGRRADKRRKLYNGMISCRLYQFFDKSKIN